MNAFKCLSLPPSIPTGKAAKAADCKIEDAKVNNGGCDKDLYCGKKDGKATC